MLSRGIFDKANTRISRNSNDEMQCITEVFVSLGLYCNDQTVFCAPKHSHCTQMFSGSPMRLCTCLAEYYPRYDQYHASWYCVSDVKSNRQIAKSNINSDTWPHRLFSVMCWQDHIEICFDLDVYSHHCEHPNDLVVLELDKGFRSPCRLELPLSLGSSSVHCLPIGRNDRNSARCGLTINRTEAGTVYRAVVRIRPKSATAEPLAELRAEIECSHSSQFFQSSRGISRVTHFLPSSFQTVSMDPFSDEFNLITVKYAEIIPTRLSSTVSSVILKLEYFLKRYQFVHAIVEQCWINKEEPQFLIIQQRCIGHVVTSHGDIVNSLFIYLETKYLLNWKSQTNISINCIFRLCRTCNSCLKITQCSQNCYTNSQQSQNVGFIQKSITVNISDGSNSTFVMIYFLYISTVFFIFDEY